MESDRSDKIITEEFESQANKEPKQKPIDRLNASIIKKNMIMDLTAIYKNINCEDIDDPVDIDYVLSRMTQPIIIIEKYSLVAIFNLGMLPSTDHTFFYKENIKRPINYKCKRLYYKHSLYRGDTQTNMMFYTCKLGKQKDLPYYVITTDDGLRVHGGKSAFNELASLFGDDIKFKNMDDFFGLRDPNVQKAIENGSYRSNSI